MNSIKTFLALAALGGAAYAVYVTITTSPGDIDSGQGNTADLDAGFPPVDFGTGAGDPLASQGQHSSPGFGLPAPLGVNAAPANVDPMKADAAPVGVDPMKAAPNNHPARPIPTSSPASVGQATDNQPPIPPRDPKQGARGAAAALAAAEFAAAKREIQAALAAGRFVEALRKSSTWYHWDGPSRVPPQEREWHQGLLSQLAGTVVYSRRHFLEEPYQVQHGDTLRQIAQRFQVPSRLLANINGISDAGPLRLGQSLKVIRGPLDAYLSLNQSRLALRLGDLYAGVFDIGIGRDFNAPPGESVVQLKLRNPAYRGLDATIGADAPNNPLGEHWIDLGGPYGIHGANGEFTAGRSAARGYIRMRNQDVAQLYDILSIGSRVVIGNHRPDEVAPGVAERTGSANPRPR